MTDGQPNPTSFPHYAPPAPAVIADRRQSAILMKAIKHVGKLMSRKPTGSAKRGLTTPDTIHIKKRKPKWY